jgi:DNA-binding NtrC family response regulator
MQHGRAGSRPFGRTLNRLFWGVPRDIVLCVDDEAIILRACSIAVARAGLRTVVAENGIAGLEAFKNLRDEICLVLTDVIMPGFNGLELADRIREIDPRAKVLLMSGYGDTVIDLLSSPDRYPLIRKPFIHSMLIDRIREELGTSDAAASGS